MDLRTCKSECQSINAIIPSYHDIEFIRKNNPDDKIDNKAQNLENPEDAKKGDQNMDFFVNTKFHFGNNSWTWANGGRINATEWLVVEGSRPINPLIPIQVSGDRYPRAGYTRVQTVHTMRTVRTM